MEFNDKALVLKVGRFREHDALVRLLSPSRGLYTAFAFGGLKSRRRFCGCLDPFNLVQFKLKTSLRPGSMAHLLEGRLVASAPGLRRNLENLGMACNCAKFFEAAQAWQGNAEPAYKLLLEMVRTLSQAENPPVMLPLYFRLRVAFDSGYAPNFSACYSCAKPLSGQEARFALASGRAYCTSCAAAGPEALRLAPETLALLGDIARLAPQEWLRLDASPWARRQCQDLAENFVGRHLGLVWDNDRFRRI